MKRVTAFDFDGTITCKDTLIEFLRYTHQWKFYFYFLFLSPVLICFKMGFIPNDKAKEILFSFFYKGWHIHQFNDYCNTFAPTIRVRPLALKSIEEYIRSGNSIVIVSASIENWVQPWATLHGIAHVLGTQIEVIDNHITGRFSSKNCYGAEKVNRLNAFLGDRSGYYLIAYGDSSGDKNLIDYADEGYMKKF